MVMDCTGSSWPLHAVSSETSNKTLMFTHAFSISLFLLTNAPMGSVSVVAKYMHVTSIWSPNGPKFH